MDSSGGVPASNVSSRRGSSFSSFISSVSPHLPSTYPPPPPRSLILLLTLSPSSLMHFLFLPPRSPFLFLLFSLFSVHLPPLVSLNNAGSISWSLSTCYIEAVAAFSSLTRKFLHISLEWPSSCCFQQQKLSCLGFRARLQLLLLLLLLLSPLFLFRPTSFPTFHLPSALSSECNDTLDCVRISSGY